MTDTSPELERKRIAPRLVATLRFFGDYDELPAKLDRIRQAVGDRAEGKPLLLFHGGMNDYGWDVELCLPVSEPFEADGITCRTLEGGEMLTLRHVGPHATLPETWGRFWSLLRAGGMGVTEGPFREVWVEDAAEHGDDEAKYVTEIQAMCLTPVWLSRLTEGLDRAVGEEERRRITTGAEALTETSSPADKSRWAREMIERLDAAIADPAARAEIMSGCAHRFPEWRIEKMRKVYEETENIDEVLYHLGRDQRWSAPHFYSPPWREHCAVYMTKIAHDPAAWIDAGDDNARAAAYCHCPLIKDALRNGVEISETYCQCGGGFYKRLWEGIIGKPVEMELVESVLKGDDRCTFAIHLPEDV